MISSSDLLSRRDSGINLSPALMGQEPFAEGAVRSIAVMSRGALADTGDR